MAKITTITNPLTGQPAQVDQLDHTAQQIDDGLNIARGVSNPNLLDNPYFGNPVDQRGGYVVPPGTNVYNDSGLTSLVGASSVYYKVVEFGSTYAKILNESGGYFYSARSAAVRGYTGSGYGIDRWFGDNATVTILNDGIKITGQSNYGNIFTKIENADNLKGKKITFSVLVTDGDALGQSYLDIYYEDNTESAKPITSLGVSSITITLPTNKKVARFGIVTSSSSGKSITIKAAKLELGPQQTLAHQENGVWVLNEIPDYGEQLLRCQRYFQTFATESLRPTDALDFRPVMRANPALSTINVDEKTLYTASADL